MTTIIFNAEIVTTSEIFRGYVVINNEIIEKVGEGIPDTGLINSCIERIDLGGDMLMAGVIDTHVHFRDPGLTHKGDMQSESKAGIAGGVTSIIDMPNTKPQTTDFSNVEFKKNIADKKSWANYGFFIGATNDNANELIKGNYSECAGVKVFLGSSTGNMCVNDTEIISLLAEKLPEDVPMAFHAEDEEIIKRNIEIVKKDSKDLPIDLHPEIRSREACLKSAAVVKNIAQSSGRKCVLLHLSTKEEILLCSGIENLFLETCPQYLMFDCSDYLKKGSRIKCNPAIKEREDKESLQDSLKDIISVISTDHAPHLMEEKIGNVLEASSGMPGIQFSLRLLLSVTDPKTVTKLMSANQARIYGISKRGEIKPGYFADLIRIKYKPSVIKDAEVISKCGWTPYNNMTVNHEVVTTWVNGKPVFDNGVFNPANRCPLPLRFCRQS
ncbi:MAG: amidohydrolase family protein [Muribaculaceae bacterium]|nr:amidohydrolase family protein [Muribaculaceae bacterium]